MKRVGVLEARRMLDMPPAQRPVAPKKHISTTSKFHSGSGLNKSRQSLPVKVPTFNAGMNVSLAGKSSSRLASMLDHSGGDISSLVFYYPIQLI